MSSETGASPPDENHIHIAHLLASIAGRDADALSQLYDQFSHALRSIAFRVLSDAAEADDVLQEVFIKVWDRAAQYVPALGTPATWLITITRNAALNRLRGRNRNIAAMERAAAEPSHQTTDADSAFECVVSGETILLVREALASLPDEQRIPLEMAYLRGLTYEEVAEALGHPLGSVKSRVRRGMARMKLALTGCYPTQS
jgi:RNA polymerase sigma-70 factor, ECF subfamily